MPVEKIMAPKLLDVVRRIEQRGAVETAHWALQNCGQVFRYAAATGWRRQGPVSCATRHAYKHDTESLFVDMFETYAPKGDLTVQLCCCANSAKRKAM